jgi:hypothetical protein
MKSDHLATTLDVRGVRHMGSRDRFRIKIAAHPFTLTTQRNFKSSSINGTISIKKRKCRLPVVLSAI